MITTLTQLSTRKIGEAYKRLNIIQSGRCILCNAKSMRPMDLCQACEDELPNITKACYRCAIPLAPISSASSSEPEFNNPEPPESKPLCGHCLSTNPPQTRAISLYLYDFPLDRLITQLKFSRQMHYGRVMGQLLANAIAHRYQGQAMPDALIPVPLSKQRLRERGFNQATLIAAPIAKALDIPLLKYHCLRSRHTEAQSGLNASARHKNLINAFAVRKPLVNKLKQPLRHIAIVDDVMTTGATLESLAKTLLNKHVERVDFWTIARTPD